MPTEVDFIPKQFVVTSETEPAAFEGLIWYNPTTKLWKQYKSGQWQIIIPLIVSETEPTEVQAGLIWYNPVTKKLQAYNGTKFEEIIKKQDLLPLIAQLTELTFIHDVEYFLQKNELDFAEVLFFDEIPAIVTKNTFIHDATNKELKQDNTIKTSHDMYNDFALFVTDNFYKFSAEISTSSCGSGSSWTLVRNGARTNTYPSFLEKTLEEDIYAVHVAGWHYDLDVNDLIIDVLLNGTQVASKTISCAGGSYAPWVNVSCLIFIEAKKNDVLRLNFNSVGNSTLIDSVTFYNKAILELDLTPNQVSAVMPIASWNEIGGLEIVATDGTNEYTLTNKQLIEFATLLNGLKVVVKSKLDDLYEILILDNLAVLWREV